MSTAPQLPSNWGPRPNGRSMHSLLAPLYDYADVTDERLDDLESRSGTSVAGNVATFAELPGSAEDGQSWIVRTREHAVPHPALYTWSGLAGAWSEPVSIQGAATEAAVAVAVQTPTVLAALTSNGRRPVGKDELVVNVRDYGAVGDGVTNDAPAIHAAIAATNARGGGVVYLPPGTYLVTTPITLASNVTLRGDGSRNTVIRKTNSVTAGGINCVLYGLNITTFTLEELRLEGDRVTGSGAAVTGLHLNGSNYFTLRGITARNCDYGFRFVTCWVGKVERCLAQQCHRQSYYSSDSCTSLQFNSCTSWACGGGWRIEGSVYMSIINAACDYNSAGGRPDDPMSSVGGSGGNYLAPQHVFQIIGSQGVSIVSPGSENGYSQYLYAEGADVVITAPYAWRFKNYAAVSRFIELRGAAACNVHIIGPKFTEITNEVAVNPNIRAIHADDPKRQKVKLSQFVKFSDTYGAFEYVKPAIEYAHRNILYGLDQYGLKVGDSSPFVPQSAAGSTVVVNEGGVKYLRFVSTATDATAFFRAPLPAFGTFRVQLNGLFHNAFDAVQIRLIETNGTTTNILRAWANDGNNITHDDYVTVNSTMSVLLEVRVARAQENLRFSTLRITEIL